MVDNPFEYRLLARGEQFVNRKEELEEIVQTVKSGQNLTIYSPRRYGKSSLIKESLDRLRKERITAYIDFNRVNSVSDLADHIISSITENAYSSTEKGFSFLKDTLISLRPTFTPTEDGGLTVSVKMVEKEKDLEKALQYPQKVAEKKGTDIVIAMDEFQRINTLNGDDLQRLLRSVIQEQDKVTYLFSGSQVNMLKEMFESGDRPFFKSTKVMKLDKIPTSEFKRYVIDSFQETGIQVKEELVSDIFDITEGHPMRTKQLCFEIWNRKQSDGMELSVREILQVMIENDIYIEEVWESVRSAVQRRTLKALAENKSLYSQETIEEYDLKSASHVQRSLKSLERKGIIFEGDIVDPFLKEWIRNPSR